MRAEYVPAVLVVKLRQDVLGALPHAFAHSGGRRVSTSSPVGHLAELRNAGVIEDVIPVFSGPGGRHVRGRRASSAELDVIGRAFAASIQDPPTDDLKGINVLKLSPRANVTDLERDLRANTIAIEYVHRAAARWIRPPSALTAGAVTSFEQWNLKAIRWRKGLADASTVKVGILDTGIDSKHPNLPRLASYSHEGASADDIIGHGTQVAGVIAARPTKTASIKGMCRCKLNVWKIFADPFDPDDDCYYTDVVMYQRALNAARLAGMDVLNLSIVGTAFDRTEELLFNRLASAGTIVVAAMGNDYLNDNPTQYPAAFNGVVAVGATDMANRHAEFSSTGRHIALCAPGVDILSTLPVRESAVRNGNQTRFSRSSGTSMASPHVTAAAALLIAKHSGISRSELVARLQNAATRLPGMRSYTKTVRFGTGLLNVAAALR